MEGRVAAGVQGWGRAGALSTPPSPAPSAGGEPQGSTPLIFDPDTPALDDPDALMPLDCARAGLLRSLAPVAPEAVATTEALGLVLARGVHAWEDLPARSLALIEGFAVSSYDTVGAGAYAPAILVVPPVRVGPGGPIPTDCDAVLPLHAVEGEEGLAEVLVQATPGDNVRRAGEDARAGGELIAAGRVLGPLEQGLALAAGVDEVLVRRPRVAVLGRDGPARSMLEGAILREGALPVAVAGPDVSLALLLSPDHDGFDPSAAGIALRPGGEGITLGRLGASPAIVVGSRPEHVLAAIVALVNPALRRMTQRTEPVPVQGRLTTKIASQVGMSDLAVLAASRAADGAPLLTPLGVGDIPWSRLGAADAAMVVEAGHEGYPAGATITADLL